MSAGDCVNLVRGQTPADYHCTCVYCKKVIGELRPNEHEYYSRLERRQYYAKSESGKEGHVAKTPLHIARWAVQTYTKKGDWVLDPTMGAGTTAVEAITQGRRAAGMELQYGEILKANLAVCSATTDSAAIRLGDARNIESFLVDTAHEYQLIVNNPPYSGDEHAGIGHATSGSHTWMTSYEDGLPNLAFLKEKSAYWEAMQSIYAACTGYLKPGGHFVIGIKDMMRAKKPLLLHQQFCDLLVSLGLAFEGTAFLKHHPTTLHLNTYEKRYGVPAPLYQTISVFKKTAEKQKRNRRETENRKQEQ